MSKVLVVSREIFLNLYENGLNDFKKKSQIPMTFFHLDYPKEKLSLIDNLMFKYNINSFKKKYYRKEREKFIDTIKKYDIILFINLFFDEEYFINDEIKNVLKNKKCILWLVDSLKTFPEKLSFLDIFNKIYTFEYQDIDYAKLKYNVNIEYLTTGTSYYLYLDEDIKNKEYDICFVGVATKKRLRYLNEIAKWCKKNRKTLFIAGHFWHNNNFINYYIGKIKFAIKYPFLFNYVQNNYINPIDLAKIYQKSRICLNINVEYHKNLNQRNFDIMICNSLLISDKQEVGEVKLKPGCDFIMCNDEYDMIDKIEYYLKNEDERNLVANNGYNITKNMYLYSDTMNIVFKKELENEMQKKL